MNRANESCVETIVERVYAITTAEVIGAGEWSARNWHDDGLPRYVSFSRCLASQLPLRSKHGANNNGALSPVTD
jgi:hypothetical protein